MNRRRIAAIVLAGGASSRFGSDKLVARLDGRPLLDHALLAIDQVAQTIVVVVAPGEVPTIGSALRAEVLIAHDSAAYQGPLAGLAAGLAELSAAGSNPDRAILVGGDMPSLVPTVLDSLLDVLDGPGIAAATLEADPPSALPMALRPRLVAPAIAALLAEERRALRGILARVPSSVVPAKTWRAHDPDGRTLRDVDTRGDLHQQ